MTELLMRFTSLPNLHPALVHFPVAILPIAILLDLSMLPMRRQRHWLDRAACVLYSAAAVGGVAAYWAGHLAVEGLPPLALDAQAQVNTHSDSATISVWLMGLLAVARVAVAVRDTKSQSTVPRVALLAFALVASALVYRTADLGGGLVYQYGIGVADRGSPDSDEPTVATTGSEVSHGAGGDAASRLVERADGTTIWTPLPEDRQALGTVLTPAPGTHTAAVAWAEPQGGAGGLGLAVDGEALLLLPGTYGDVEVKAELIADGFNGELGLAHHVASGSEAGLLTVSFPENEFSLVLRKGGEPSMLAQATRHVSKAPFQLAVTVSGRHLHGFLGEERVVHGHASPSSDGGCGLFLHGQGTVRILSMSITTGDA